MDDELSPRVRVAVDLRMFADVSGKRWYIVTERPSEFGPPYLLMSAPYSSEEECKADYDRITGMAPPPVAHFD